jgi:hypothetical protein
MALLRFDDATFYVVACRFKDFKRREKGGVI